jgi:hypothetical protein
MDNLCDDMHSIFTKLFASQLFSSIQNVIFLRKNKHDVVLLMNMKDPQ